MSNNTRRYHTNTSDQPTSGTPQGSQVDDSQLDRDLDDADFLASLDNQEE